MSIAAERIVFLDRDGVVNRDPAGWTHHGYVTTWDDFQFLPGVLLALRLLKEHDYRVVLISNQAGVGKGCLPRGTLDDITSRMRDVIRQHGGDVEAVYYCTHHPEDGCACRKPRPGLFEIAARDLGIDPSGKFFVGDTLRDVEAGQRAGCRVIFVGPRTEGAQPLAEATSSPERVEDTLFSAVRWILGLPPEPMPPAS